MTPEEHNKYVGISHLVYASLLALLGFGMTGMFLALTRSGAPARMMLFMGGFMAALYALMTIPSFIAGYGLLKGRSWARMASIIGAVTAAMNFPLGTAVCVYTFWFLFSEPGKAIFEKRNYMLPPGRQSWASTVGDRQEETAYTPPPTPPDWR